MPKPALGESHLAVPNPVSITATAPKTPKKGAGAGELLNCQYRSGATNGAAGSH